MDDRTCGSPVVRTAEVYPLGGRIRGMDTATRTAASLLAGVVALLVVGVGVTEALAPRVWPSLLVGIPAGVAAALLAGVSVWWWLGRTRTRRESD